MDSKRRVATPPAFAHSLAGRPQSEWEPLEHHLQKVAELCAEYASAFAAEEWGRTIGWWHDLGKYSDAFQAYVKRAGGDPDAGEDEHLPGRVDHSTFGAQHAVAKLSPQIGRLVAFCIAGHHAGLPDASSDDVTTLRRTLEHRLTRAVPIVRLTSGVHVSATLRLPFHPDGNLAGFQVAFFTRMLFSCLIDADRTATEAFCNPERAARRQGGKPALDSLATVLDAYLDAKEADSRAADTAVNRVRQSVRRQCLNASGLGPGFFSLQVPTGGGKTLSSLAFGLRHALRHGLRRVVVALPFTSIVEQSADEFRKAFGASGGRAVLEHHSNVRPAHDTLRNQLAAENWDAPVIVTTNVQLYESAFASATRACRKLHRLTRSVIILDEAQTIPVDLLAPTLAALRELVSHYGCTVVLCTATQPALERREGFAIGIENVRPIVTDAAAMFAALRRVTIESLGLVPDDGLASRLADEHTALCVVNSRAHAAGLYDAVSANGSAGECFHLSTLMCAEHRRSTLLEIRGRLARGLPCRVVSTQLVEAGVDIDFPAVYRAPAGFDSLAQAAGRCNREGKLEQGRFYLFETESLPPAGMLRQSAQVARELMGVLWPGSSEPDPLAPEAVTAYFRQYYWSQQHLWDRYHVMEALEDPLDRPVLRLRFRTASERYRVIRHEQAPVLVPYDDTASSLARALCSGAEVDYAMLRTAQRYLVSVWPNLLARLEQRGAVVPHEESGLRVLVRDDLYTRAKGLALEQQDAATDVWVA